MRAGKPFRLELAVGGQHRGAVDAESRGQLTLGREFVSIRQIAADDLLTQGVGQLQVQRLGMMAVEFQVHGCLQSCERSPFSLWYGELDGM